MHGLLFKIACAQYWVAKYTKMIRLVEISFDWISYSVNISKHVFLIERHVRTQDLQIFHWFLKTLELLHFKHFKSRKRPLKRPIVPWVMAGYYSCIYAAGLAPDLQILPGGDQVGVYPNSWMVYMGKSWKSHSKNG